MYYPGYLCGWLANSIPVLLAPITTAAALSPTTTAAALSNIPSTGATNANTGWALQFEWSGPLQVPGAMTVHSTPSLHRGSWDCHCVATSRHHVEAGALVLGTHLL